jgi:hypothetical protein
MVSQPRKLQLEYSGIYFSGVEVKGGLGVEKIRIEKATRL